MLKLIYSLELEFNCEKNTRDTNCSKNLNKKYSQTLTAFIKNNINKVMFLHKYTLEKIHTYVTCM